MGAIVNDQIKQTRTGSGQRVSQTFRVILVRVETVNTTLVEQIVAVNVQPNNLRVRVELLPHTLATAGIDANLQNPLDLVLTPLEQAIVTRRVVVTDFGGVCAVG